MSNIKIRLDGKPGLFSVGSFTFSGGEEHVSLASLPMKDRHLRGQRIAGEQANISHEKFIDCSRLDVIARLQSSQALVQLLLVTEIVNRLGPHTAMTLTIPYLPYARQDRVTVTEEAFSLQCLATLLNIPIYYNIKAYDLHSAVAHEYMPKLREIKQLDIIKKHKLLMSYIQEKRPVVLAPDKGALDKSFLLAKEFGLPLMVAHKVRDAATGKIISTEIPNISFLTGKNVLVADDICDGGRTFVELGILLERAEVQETALYVTHGIFSKGHEELEKYFSAIFTTDTFLSASPGGPADLVFTQSIVEEL
jgi:ribose-phosphate pyrophosphokinase